MMKETLSVRIDPKIKAKAQATGLDLRAYIEAFLAKLTKQSKCPYCGHVKDKKTKV
jgi:antitoxin component of RelBE/YafQ-DinJ toxin-antitoxin module